jgi:CheY-like chemotaxis protein
MLLTSSMLQSQGRERIRNMIDVETRAPVMSVSGYYARPIAIADFLRCLRQSVKRTVSRRIGGAEVSIEQRERSERIPTRPSLHALRFTANALGRLGAGHTDARDSNRAWTATGNPRAQDYILLAEDDAALRHLIEITIVRAGYRVETTDHGSSALRRARAAPPELVITDYMMPEMDGIALIRALRADRQLAHIPVILFTGMAHEQRLQQRLEHIPGVVHVVSKGANIGELVRTIAGLVPTASSPGLLRPGAGG